MPHRPIGHEWDAVVHVDQVQQEIGGLWRAQHHTGPEAGPRRVGGGRRAMVAGGSRGDMLITKLAGLCQHEGLRPVLMPPRRIHRLVLEEAVFQIETGADGRAGNERGIPLTQCHNIGEVLDWEQGGTAGWPAWLHEITNDLGAESPVFKGDFQSAFTGRTPLEVRAEFVLGPAAPAVQPGLHRILLTGYQLILVYFSPVDAHQSARQLSLGVLTARIDTHRATELDDPF